MIKERVEKSGRVTCFPFSICLGIFLGCTLLMISCGQTGSDEQSDDFQSLSVLEGRWIRPDGGYRLEIHEVSEEGEVRAAYYNPNPINISTARAHKEGDKIRLQIEFRDVGYPGSAYNLTYQPDSDIMTGEYFQATMNQTYEIQFVRLPISDR